MKNQYLSHRLGSLYLPTPGISFFFYCNEKSTLLPNPNDAPL